MLSTSEGSYHLSGETKKQRTRRRKGTEKEDLRMFWTLRGQSGQCFTLFEWLTVFFKATFTHKVQNHAYRSFLYRSWTLGPSRISGSSSWEKAEVRSWTDGKSGWCGLQRFWGWALFSIIFYNLIFFHSCLSKSGLSTPFLSCPQKSLCFLVWFSRGCFSCS